MAGKRAFDELWGKGQRGKARAGFEPLARWLKELPPAELDPPGINQGAARFGKADF